MIYSSREENGDRFCRGIFSWILKKEEGIRRAAPWCRREGLHKFVASQPVIARAHFSPVAILCGKDSSHTLGMTWRRESLKGFPSVTAPPYIVAINRCGSSRLAERITRSTRCEEQRAMPAKEKPRVLRVVSFYGSIQFKLTGIQFIISSLHGEQIIVVAAFQNFAFLDDHDGI